MIVNNMVLLPLLALAATASAQQVYISAQGPSPRPYCTSCEKIATPTYSFRPFSYTQSETYRTATSRPAPTTTSTYAPAYDALSSLVPNLSTTSWGSFDPNATAQATDTANPYGNAAWSALWVAANLTNFTTSAVYSSTVSPTPLPTSELILPPPEYFGPTDCYNFPEGFIFGVAGSAAQIEGAVYDEGKAPSLMEILTQSNGEPSDQVTNENYYLYKQDIERLASIGVKYYSFSIAWSRILPFALPGTPVNELGLKHYDDLINFVLEKGMIPTVTMFHFDTPLQFLGEGNQLSNPPEIGYVNGGYSNSTFEDAFVNYGQILLTHYADRVPVWFTFNEPFIYTSNGTAVNNVIKAHARLYHFYHENIKGTGKVGIKFNDNLGVPKDPQNASHVDAATHFNDYQLATFANPIFLGLDYPDAFKNTVTDYVPLTAEDLAYLNHTADFLGIDPYTATVVSPPPGGVDACVANKTSPYRGSYCVTQETTNAFGWNIGYRSQSYVYTTPTYLRTYLFYLYNTFRAPVLISEFGFPVFAESQKDLTDQLYDSPRSQYYVSFMSEVLKAIWEDGVDVMGALAWSFADNWEFGDFGAQFGVQFVNRTTQERRFKKSIFDLVDFVVARTVGEN